MRNKVYVGDKILLKLFSEEMYSLGYRFLITKEDLFELVDRNPDIGFSFHIDRKIMYVTVEYNPYKGNEIYTLDSVDKLEIAINAVKSWEDG